MNELSIVGNFASILGLIISGITLVVGVKISNKLKNDIITLNSIREKIPNWIYEIQLWIKQNEKGVETDFEVKNSIKSCLYQMNDVRTYLKRAEKSMRVQESIEEMINEALNDIDDNMDRFHKIVTRLENIEKNI